MITALQPTDLIWNEYEIANKGKFKVCDTVFAPIKTLQWSNKNTTDKNKKYIRIVYINSKNKKCVRLDSKI